MAPERVFRIPSLRLAELQGKIDSLNRRAIKLGLAGIEFKLLGTENQDGNLLHLVALRGEAPVLAGWRVVARLEHSSEVGSLVRVLPGQTVPEQYQNAVGDCDHCHVKRRRKETYIIHHLDGRWAQVGSNCLKDFTGHHSPAEIARYAELLLEVSDRAEEVDEKPKNSTLMRDEFLAACASTIRLHGYFSHKQAIEAKTISTAWRALLELENKERLEISNADRLLAREASAWIRGLRSNRPMDDYHWNLKVAAMQPVLDKRWTGLLASLIPTYQKLRNRLEKRGIMPMGNPGDQIEKVLYVRHQSTFEQKGLPQHLYRFQDEDGAWAVFFSPDDLGLEVGESHEVKAKIIRTEIYAGRMQAILEDLEVV